MTIEVRNNPMYQVLRRIIPLKKENKLWADWYYREERFQGRSRASQYWPTDKVNSEGEVKLGGGGAGAEQAAVDEGSGSVYLDSLVWSLI